VSVALRVTLTETDSSEAMDRRIRTELEKLTRFHPSITACHVTLESHRGHPRNGTSAVRIAIALPTGEVALDHKCGPDEAGEDPLITIQDCFAAARRALLQRAKRVRGEAKADAAAAVLREAAEHDELLPTM